MRKNSNLQPEWILREQLNRRINKNVLVKDSEIGKKDSTTRKTLKSLKAKAKFKGEVILKTTLA